MKVRLGYVSISRTLGVTSSHTVTYTNYKKLSTSDGYNKLKELTKVNLDNLYNILIYNIRNGIHFYRMSSSIFPLVMHPDVDIDILDIFRKQLKKIGELINEYSMRVDIHLDSYCVLNSTNKVVVNSTINAIIFFKNMFNYMGIKSHMVIHVGGSTFGKKQGMYRFINNFKLLDDDCKKLLIIENDDKVYNVSDVLNLCNLLKVPMVLDYHHYVCNHDCDIKVSDFVGIFKTWNGELPKVHFSSPKSLKEKRSHNDYINVDDFISFLDLTKGLDCDFDVMLEAKEKDNALFNLVRLLKYKGVNFLDETTISYDVF